MRQLSLLHTVLVFLFIASTTFSKPTEAQKHATLKVQSSPLDKKPTHSAFRVPEASPKPSPPEQTAIHAAKPSITPKPPQEKGADKPQTPSINGPGCESKAGNLTARGCGISRPARPQSIPMQRQYRCPKHWTDVQRDGFRRPPAKDRSLFYANRGSTQAVRTIANRHGKIILSDALITDYKRWSIRNCPKDKFWKLASEAFARMSSGEVNVLLDNPSPGRDAVDRFHPKQGGPKKGQQTIWHDIEYPALEQNTAVDRVMRSFVHMPLERSVALFDRRYQGMAPPGQAGPSRYGRDEIQEIAPRPRPNTGGGGKRRKSKRPRSQSSRRQHG